MRSASRSRSGLDETATTGASPGSGATHSLMARTSRRSMLETLVFLERCVPVSFGVTWTTVRGERGSSEVISGLYLSLTPAWTPALARPCVVPTCGPPRRRARPTDHEAAETLDSARTKSGGNDFHPRVANTHPLRSLRATYRSRGIHSEPDLCPLSALPARFALRSLHAMYFSRHGALARARSHWAPRAGCGCLALRAERCCSAQSCSRAPCRVSERKVPGCLT